MGLPVSSDLTYKKSKILRNLLRIPGIKYGAAAVWSWLTHYNERSNIDDVYCEPIFPIQVLSWLTCVVRRPWLL
jgi:hypothetical protein